MVIHLVNYPTVRLDDCLLPTVYDYLLSENETVACAAAIRVKYREPRERRVFGVVPSHLDLIFTGWHIGTERYGTGVC